MTRSRQTADERLAACLADAQMAAERAALRATLYRQNLAEARASFAQALAILEDFGPVGAKEGR